MKSLIGTIKDTKESVQEVKALRKKLSKEKFNLEEVNRLAD